MPELPEARDRCLAAGIAGKIYIAAGRSGGIYGIEPESWVYDPQNESFEEIAPIPMPRGGVAGGVIDGAIYVFGGEGNPNDPVGMFAQIEAYDTRTDTWETVDDPSWFLGERPSKGASI